MTTTAGTIASRKANAKSSPGATKLSVRCVHTDPASGFNEYFVVPHGKKRGAWHSEETVDLNSLIQHRVEQRRPYVARRDRLLIEQAQRKKKLQEQQVQSNRPSTGSSISGSGTKRKTPATTSSIKIKPLPPPSAKKPKKTNNNNTTLKMKQEWEFQASVNHHRDGTFRLLKASAARGEASVPTDKMAEVRAHNLALMKTANAAGSPRGDIGIRKKLSENELTRRMAQAEQDAVGLYIKEMQALKKRKASSAAAAPQSQPTKAQQDAKKRKLMQQRAGAGVFAKKEVTKMSSGPHQPSTTRQYQMATVVASTAVDPAAARSLAMAKHIVASTHKTDLTASAPPSSANMTLQSSSSSVQQSQESSAVQSSSTLTKNPLIAASAPPQSVNSLLIVSAAPPTQSGSVVAAMGAQSTNQSVLASHNLTADISNNSSLKPSSSSSHPTQSNN